MNEFMKEWGKESEGRIELEEFNEKYKYDDQ